jgi:hypothetical protein
LKENMPKALKLVPLTSIRWWEHWMYRWMEAYRSGLGTSAAQLQVKRFGSAKYKSHRWVPETVARAFDWRRIPSVHTRQFGLPPNKFLTQFWQ